MSSFELPAVNHDHTFQRGHDVRPGVSHEGRGCVEVGLTGRDANVPTEVPFPRVCGFFGRGMGGCRLSTCGSAEPWCIGAGASAESHRRLAMKVYRRRDTKGPEPKRAKETSLTMSAMGRKFTVLKAHLSDPSRVSQPRFPCFTCDTPMTAPSTRNPIDTEN